MRTPRDYSGYQPIKLEPEISDCPSCRRPLRRAYHSDRRVAFLHGRQEILYDARHCTHPTCELRGIIYRPSILQGGAMLPKHEYGLDVIALIGTRRLTRHETFAQIAQELREQYQVPIQERWVEDLFTVYLALVATNVREDPVRFEKLRAQGRIILAIDGAQPEADSEGLWVIRDTISGEVLKGFSALGLDAPRLAQELREIRRWGIPIAGVVSDAQNIIVEAVQKALQGVPHQLCQIHFLRDFAKPVSAADRALKEDLAKGLRGLSAFERAATEKGSQSPPKGEIVAPKSLRVPEPPADRPRRQGRPRTRARLCAPRSAEEAAVVRNVCEILRAILKHHGRYPLQTPGLKTRGMIQQVLGALDQGLPKGGS